MLNVQLHELLRQRDGLVFRSGVEDREPADHFLRFREWAVSDAQFAATDPHTRALRAGRQPTSLTMLEETLFDSATDRIADATFDDYFLPAVIDVPTSTSSSSANRMRSVPSGSMVSAHPLACDHHRRIAACDMILLQSPTRWLRRSKQHSPDVVRGRYATDTFDA
jgi:hypothetical protein